MEDVGVLGALIPSCSLSSYDRVTGSFGYLGLLGSKAYGKVILFS